MNAREISDVLELNERTVRRAIADGRLPAEKYGRAFEIDLEQARAVLAPGHRRQTRYQEALAEALMLLRAFGNQADAEDLERRYGLVYVEPTPKVTVA